MSEIAGSGGLVVIQDGGHEDEEEEKEDTRTRRTASLRQRISAGGATVVWRVSLPLSLAAPLARVQEYKLPPSSTTFPMDRSSALQLHSSV